MFYYELIHIHQDKSGKCWRHARRSAGTEPRLWPDTFWLERWLLSPQPPPLPLFPTHPSRTRTLVPSPFVLASSARQLARYDAGRGDAAGVCRAAPVAWAAFLGMSCPSWQWHRTGSRWSPVWTLPVAPLWCDLGFFPNSRGNKAAANLRPGPLAELDNISRASH